MATLICDSNGVLCMSNGALLVCCDDETCCDVTVTIYYYPSSSSVSGDTSGKHHADSRAECSEASAVSEAATSAAMPYSEDEQPCACASGSSGDEVAVAARYVSSARIRKKSGRASRAAYLHYSNTRLWTGGDSMTIDYGIEIAFNSNAGHPTVRVDCTCGSQAYTFTRAWSEGGYQKMDVASTTTTGTTYATPFDATVYVY